MAMFGSVTMNLSAGCVVSLMKVSISCAKLRKVILAGVLRPMVVRYTSAAVVMKSLATRLKYDPG